MKKMIATAMAAGFMAAAASAKVSAEVSMTLDLASAYVFRGVTYNDGLVFQPGIEASGFGLPEDMGVISVGAWANYDIDDYGGALDSHEFSEVDWYASYTLPSMVHGLDVSLGYCEYTYPNAAATADKEGSIGLGYAIGEVGLGARAYFNVGCGDTDLYYELTAGYDYEVTDAVSLSVGASVGYFEPENGDSGFQNERVSAGLGYALTDVWSLGVSGTYIAQLDEDILPDGMYSYEAKVRFKPPYVAVFHRLFNFQHRHRQCDNGSAAGQLWTRQRRSPTTCWILDGSAKSKPSWQYATLPKTGSPSPETPAPIMVKNKGSRSP